VVNRLEHIRQRLADYEPERLPLDFPEASVLVPVTCDRQSPEIILTKRSDRLRTHGGQVAFPGGRRDPCDASLIQTALRESQEEIALDPAQVEIIGALDQVVSRFGILVTPYVGLIPSDVELKANPDELESVFRVPVDFFLKDERKRTDIISFRGVTLHVPCYQFKQYEIWGLSAIILVDLMNLVFDADIEMKFYERGQKA
jgi:8-oxo-dGTP pyrophosphatase MutT (NUDIX family)